MKNLTISPINDLNEAAYIIDKGYQMSDNLNKASNYSFGISKSQIFTLKITNS